MPPVTLTVRKERKTISDAGSMETAHNLGASAESIARVVASFGVNISIFMRMEVFMNLNVVMTSLVAGVALLWRSGDGSEIRRGKMREALSA